MLQKDANPYAFCLIINFLLSLSCIEELLVHKWIRILMCTLFFFLGYVTFLNHYIVMNENTKETFQVLAKELDNRGGFLK